VLLLLANRIEIEPARCGRVFPLKVNVPYSIRLEFGFKCIKYLRYTCSDVRHIISLKEISAELTLQLKILILLNIKISQM